jgi:hypothetical protein
VNRRRIAEREKGFSFYQIQYWDDFSICRVNFHRSFPDPPTAESFAITVGKRYRIGSKYRIIEVSRDGWKTIKTGE